MKDEEKQWYEDAKKQTLDTLPDFLKEVTSDTYPHTYDSICHAVAAGAIAAGYAVNKSPVGGITGFQAGAVMWEFILNWQYGGKFRPLRLVDYSYLLYPQYADHFEKTITPETWQYIQDEANRFLLEHENNNNYASPAVVEHWKSIVDGNVPFGFVVRDDFII
jgi:hypothetical protein